MKHRKEDAAVPGTGETPPPNGAEAPETGTAPEAGPATPESRPPGGESEAASGPALPPAREESAESLRDRWLRAEAELQNFRRRARRDLEESTRFAEERVLLEMIDLLDDLNRAVEAAAEAGAPDSWISGIKLVATRMHDALGRHGVSAIDPAGAAFDPGQHEAMLEVDAGGAVPPGHVAQVVRKGYRRHGRVLRAARVVVARAPGENED